MRLRAQERQKGGSGPRQGVSRQTSRILEPAKPIQPNQGTRWGRYQEGWGTKGGGVWVEAPSAVTSRIFNLSRLHSFRFEISSVQLIRFFQQSVIFIRLFSFPAFFSFFPGFCFSRGEAVRRT